MSMRNKHSSRSNSWRNRYEKAVERIFSPSKGKVDRRNTNSIDESCEIVNQSHFETWENQLRKPNKFIYDKKPSFYNIKISSNYPSKLTKSSTGGTFNDYDTKQSIKVTMNAPKPTNFHNGKSNKYFINNSSPTVFDLAKRLDWYNF